MDLCGGIIRRQEVVIHVLWHKDRNIQHLKAVHTTLAEQLHAKKMLQE